MTEKILSLSEQVRILNDQARKNMGVLCRAMQTRGITALDPFTQFAIRERVANFDEFTPGDDPYEQHDFGAFTYEGHRIFWKIDYYDNNLEWGSENPANPRITQRVLTIMLAEEY